jgi:hypothetical protein
VLEANGSSKDLFSWPLCSLDEIELRKCFLGLDEEDFDVIRGLLASLQIKQDQARSRWSHSLKCY